MCPAGQAYIQPPLVELIRCAWRHVTMATAHYLRRRRAGRQRGHLRGVPLLPGPGAGHPGGRVAAGRAGRHRLRQLLPARLAVRQRRVRRADHRWATDQWCWVVSLECSSSTQSANMGHSGNTAEHADCTAPMHVTVSTIQADGNDNDCGASRSSSPDLYWLC